MQVSLLGGMSFAAPTYSFGSAIQTTSSTGALAFGALIALPLQYSFEFESGLIYQNIKFTAQGSQSSTDFQFKEIQIPFLLRYQVDEKVGFGFGAYWGVGASAVTTSTASGAQTSTFSDLNLYSNDFGLLFNIRALIPLDGQFSAVIDGRYLLGLEERAKDVSIASYKTRSIEILAGISFEF